MSTSTSINVSEMFYSIQGEGTRAGMPCVFVRLQGCKLRCTWCDTPYALDHRVKGLDVSVEDVVAYARENRCSFVEFTGGEPLEQVNVFPMIRELCDQGFLVAIETGGHVSIADVDDRAIAIIDVKCPDSKMSSLNYPENMKLLCAHDEVKFVIASRNDYEFARQMIIDHALESRVAAVLMSCVFNTVEFVDLVTWILEDKLNVRFQLQMHKFVWSPETRGV